MSIRDEILDPVYLEYFLIKEGKEHDRIRYFENHKLEIENLPYINLLEIYTDYCFALFRISAYDDFLKRVDKLIQEVVNENLERVRGLEVFNTLLFYKAMCKYEKYAYDEALYILKELIRIDNSERKYQELFCRIKLVEMRSRSEKIRASVLLMVISSALVIALELFVIRSFYPEWTNEVEALRNGLALGAIFLLIFNELFLRFVAKQHLKRIN